METVVHYTVTEFSPGCCFAMGKDGTFWRVLTVDQEAGTAVVIADREICKRAYHDKWKSVAWETCSLRAWLNGEYYNSTFSPEEKEAILECAIHTPENSEFHTPGGNDTIDKVWLLSMEEAVQWFKTTSSRA
ncbi:MAG: DUF6273 domain-containing protein, partial [Oscillospiraceae bacterium]|nr:DUF6273 domain-containing protein [Oscillospiraceae bacterium]